MAPLEPQEKGFALADWHLKSCAACGLHSRWQLCCLTDVAYPLRVIRCLPGVVSKRLGLLLSSLSLCLRFGSLTQFPPTLDLYRFAIACRGGFAGARRSTHYQDDMHCQMIRLHQNKMSRAAADDRSSGKSYSNANAASPRAGKCNRQASHLFELLACNEKFSLGGCKGGVSLFQKEIPLPYYRTPARRREQMQRCRTAILFFYSALGSFAAGFISNAQMTIARIVFGSIYVPLYSTE